MRNTSKVEKDCPKIVQCNNEDYYAEVSSGEYGGYWNPYPMVNTLFLTYRTSKIELTESVPSYSVQTLIADTGGSLGLFVGLCAISFISKRTIVTKIFM